MALRQKQVRNFRFATKADLDAATLLAGEIAYVDGLGWYQSDGTTETKLELNGSIISQLDFTTAELAAPATGDRYINTTAGASNVTAQTLLANSIVEWNGASWSELAASDGIFVYDKSLDGLIGFDGTTWAAFGGLSFVTANNLTDITGATPSGPTLGIAQRSGSMAYFNGATWATVFNGEGQNATASSTIADGTQMADDFYKFTALSVAVNASFNINGPATVIPGDTYDIQLVSSANTTFVFDSVFQNVDGGTMPDISRVSSGALDSFTIRFVGDQRQDGNIYLRLITPIQGAADPIATIVDASGGASADTLPAATGSGAVRLYAIQDSTTNAATLGVPVGESLNGTTDGSWNFGTSAKGDQFKAVDVGVGEWYITQTGANGTGVHDAQAETLTYAVAAVEAVSYTHDGAEGTGASQIQFGNVYIKRQYIGSGNAAVTIEGFVTEWHEDNAITLQLPTGYLSNLHWGSVDRNTLNTTAEIIISSPGADQITIDRDNNIDNDSQFMWKVSGIGKWVGQQPDAYVPAGYLTPTTRLSGVSTLGADYDVAGAGGIDSFEDSGLTVSVPSAGEWRIEANALGRVIDGADDGTSLAVVITDSSNAIVNDGGRTVLYSGWDGTAVGNTQSMEGSAQPFAYVTTTGAETFKLRVSQGTNTPGNILKGQTTLRFEQKSTHDVVLKDALPVVDAKDILFARTSLADGASTVLDSSVTWQTVKDDYESVKFYLRFAGTDYNYSGELRTEALQATGNDMSISVGGSSNVFIQNIELADGQFELNSSDSSAYELTIVGVKAQKTVINTTDASVTDWTSYNAAIAAETTAPTKGTSTQDNAYFKVIDKSLFVRFDFFQTTAGTAGSGVYLFTIPGGYSIDLTKVTTYLNNTSMPSVVGHGQAHQSGIERNPGSVHVYNSNSVMLYIADGANTMSAVGSGWFAMSAANNGFSFECELPLV